MFFNRLAFPFILPHFISVCLKLLAYSRFAIFPREIFFHIVAQIYADHSRASNPLCWYGHVRQTNWPYINIIKCSRNIERASTGKKGDEFKRSQLGIHLTSGQMNSIAIAQWEQEKRKQPHYDMACQRKKFIMSDDVARSLHSAPATAELFLFGILLAAVHASNVHQLCCTNENKNSVMSQI